MHSIYTEVTGESVMEQLIQLNYDFDREEIKPVFLSSYKNINCKVIKLDCLQDAIYYLQNEYDKVLKEMHHK